jgi:hypothetical protein
VVVEHRLDALLPLAALIGQRVTQPHARAQIEQMVRRDPRLRQPRDHQQLAQMPRVRAITLGALLVAAARAGLRRLGQMRPAADRADLLDHEPPTRRRLQRDVQVRATEPLQEPPHALAMRRRDPRPADLAGLDLEPVRGHLPSMLIKSHYDRHTGPPHAPRPNTCVDLPRLS